MPTTQGNVNAIPWWKQVDGGGVTPPETFFIIPENNSLYPFIAQETGLTNLMKSEIAP
jgi:hypothetical protein